MELIMITNKRQIKKYINRVCEDVAQEVLPTAVYAKAITDEEAENILTELSYIQSKAISRISISFDKTQDTFDKIQSFNTAKTAYYRQAYKKLIDDFNNEVKKILSPLNKAIASK